MLKRHPQIMFQPGHCRCRKRIGYFICKQSRGRHKICAVEDVSPSGVKVLHTRKPLARASGLYWLKKSVAGMIRQ
jgi:hypothetical protein